MSPPPKKKQARLRAQAKEDLSSYRYTLRALRAAAMFDVPSRTLDVLKEQPTDVIDYFADQEGHGPRDETNPSTSHTLDSRVPIPRIPGMPKTLFSASERLPAFVEGGPPLIALWPDANNVDYEPEWNLRDETDTLVRSYLKTGGKDFQDRGHCSDGQSSSEFSSDTEAGGPLAYRDIVYEQVSQTLTRIFSYIAMHRVEDAPDKTLYHTPMNWKDVLKILDMSDIVPQRVIQTVHARMMKSLPSEAADSTENKGGHDAWHIPLTHAREHVKSLVSDTHSGDEVPAIPADSIEIFLQNSYHRPHPSLIYKPDNSSLHDDALSSDKDMDNNSD